MALTRSQLVDALAAQTGLTIPQAADVAAAWEQLVTAAVARGEGVRLNGFLSIDVVERASRQGRNPRTGEPLTIPAGRAVKATPGAQLKAALTKAA